MAAPDSQANRIPSEALEDVRPWSLPEIDAGGNVVASAEKEDRERRQRQGEIIEDVDSEELQPVTAESLRQITEAAEAEGRERGYNDGLQRGLAEGRERALNETRAQVQATQQQLMAVCEALYEPVQAQDEALEELLTAMVCRLTQGLVQRELHTDSSHILEIVKQALAALPVGSRNITIHLNPDDLALVETYAEEQQKDWQFGGDTELLPGGCRLETRESLVDYSVEKRTEVLLSEFLDKQLSGAADPATTAPDADGVAR